MWYVGSRILPSNPKLPGRIEIDSQDNIFPHLPRSLGILRRSSATRSSSFFFCSPALVARRIWLLNCASPTARLLYSLPSTQRHYGVYTLDKPKAESRFYRVVSLVILPIYPLRHPHLPDIGRLCHFLSAIFA